LILPARRSLQEICAYLISVAVSSSSVLPVSLTLSEVKMVGGLSHRQGGTCVGWQHNQQIRFEATPADCLAVLQH
jgi:hypothetical protein